MRGALCLLLCLSGSLTSPPDTNSISALSKKSTVTTQRPSTARSTPLRSTSPRSATPGTTAGSSTSKTTSRRSTTPRSTSRSPSARIHTSDAECGLSLLSRRRPRRSRRTAAARSPARSLWSPWTQSAILGAGPQSQGRIVNGKESLQGAWPWHASLQVLHPRMGLIGHWCGGVLVRDRWVLTAAHCIYNDVFSLPLPALWTAVLGDWDRDVEEKTEVRVPVERIVVHNNFHSYNNDLALLKLSRRVRISGESRVRSICLPPAPHNTSSAPPAPPAPGESKPLCMATGWGRQSAAGDETSTLLQASVPLHSNALCAKRYGGAVRIGPGHLCAGHLDGSSGTCVGDSGGPLQCLGTDGRWFLAGITSFGSGCARPGYPDVYTRMAHYTSWIQGQLDSDVDDEEEEPEDEDQDLADY